MIAEIKLYINRLNKKGYPVVFYFRNKKIRKRVALNWYFKKEEWDFRLQQPIPSAPDFDFVYPQLINYKYLIKDLLYHNETNINAYLRIFKPSLKSKIELLQDSIKELQSEDNVGILIMFDTIITEKIKKKESVKFYKETKKQIADFLNDQDQAINTIDYDFLNGFILFKKEMGTGTPGIMAYLRTLRAVFKEAQRRPSLGVQSGNPFLGLIKNTTSEKIVDITPTDIQKFKQWQPHKFANKTAQHNMQRAINLWLFQLLIGGHDLADVAYLTYSNYKNERLQFKRFKNRNKPGGGVMVNNMVLPFAKIFIEKYGTKNNERLFDWIPHPLLELSRYQSFRNNYNRSLKTICTAQKIEILKSKSPRYVFRTLAGELLVNDLVIMQLQGHKPVGVSFSYQKTLPKILIDKHHKLIIDSIGVLLK